MNDLTGQRFDRLTAIKKTAKRQNGHIVWKCLCDCGATRYVTSNNLKNGNSKSCGCLQRERAKKSSTTHGMCFTTEYEIWCGIIQRCCNPNDQRYADYGGRGISVCERWRNSFETFHEDIISTIGLRPKGKSLDRWPDNDGGYELGNVCWATPHEQRINSRPKSYGPQKQFWFRAWHKDMMCQFINNNQSAFARKWNLTSTHISDCLNGKQRTHKGWQFQKLYE